MKYLFNCVQNTLVLFVALFLTIFATSALSQSPLCLRKQFAAMNWVDSPNDDYFPGNASSAIGPKQFIVASTTGIVSFDRKGKRDQQLSTTLATFFNNFLAYVPQIKFDTFSCRWYILSTNINNTGRVVDPATFQIAISDSAVISSCTQWTIINLRQDLIQPVGNAGQGYPDLDSDYPTFAVDKHALYIGANLYAANGTAFVSSAVFVIQKASLFNGGPVVATAFRNLTPQSNIFAPMVVDNFDKHTTTGYVIGSLNTTAAQNAVVLYKIFDVDSTNPTISAPISIPISTVVTPPNAPLLNNFGPTDTVSTLNNRISAAHIRGNQLYFARHTGLNAQGAAVGTIDRVGMRWGQISINDGMQLVKEGTLFDGGPLTQNTRSFYYPALMTNGCNDMVIGGSFSAQTIPITGFVAQRKINDPVNNEELLASVITLGTGVPYSFSVPALITNVAFGEPWGKYMSVTLDPRDKKTFWAGVQYAQKPGIWGLQGAILGRKSVNLGENTSRLRLIREIKKHFGPVYKMHKNRG